MVCLQFLLCSLSNGLFFPKRKIKDQVFEFAKKQLTERKKDNNVHFFEDLLTWVNQALERSSGKSLIESIQQNYTAALVDEFQDTDSIQYGIFSKLFPRKKRILFMIGDPKHAIYGFRGADVFSYFTAARDAENKYTLTKNWRSNPSDAVP